MDGFSFESDSPKVICERNDLVHLTHKELFRDTWQLHYLPQGHYKIDLGVLRASSYDLDHGALLDYQTTLANLLIRFAESIRRPIRCRREGQVTASLVLQSDTPFTIWIWKGAGTDRRTESPSHLWGHANYHSSEPGYTARGDGIVVMDETTGWCAAELFPNDLFIHHALMSKQIGEIPILEEILSRAAASYTGNSTTWSAQQQAFEAAELATAETAYVTLVGGRNQVVLDQKRKRQQECRGEITEARETLQRLIRENEQLTTTISALAGNSLTQEAAHRTEFKRIMSLPKVTKLTIERGRYIVVTTTPLFCKNPNTGVIYRMGTQKITVDTTANDRDDVLSWKCLTPFPGQVKAAPHVINPNGTACLGNSADVIQTLFASHEWEQLIHLAILFIESVNMDDRAGRNITQWPLATSAELVGTEWEGTQVVAGPAA
jgi:hypothetical protein